MNKEKPILFNTEMVQAIMSGRKAMTRRIVKKHYNNTDIEKHGDGTLMEVQNDTPPDIYNPETKTITRHVKMCVPIDRPYKVGDVLWVRETWQSFFPEEVTEKHKQGPRSFSGIPAESAKGHHMYFYYQADGKVENALWKPSIHMPRSAARIFLKVTNIRVERLREITAQECVNEGITVNQYENEIVTFINLWDGINQKCGYGWDVNPWVWIVEFERIEGGK